MNKNNNYWAVGFFEGEGSFSCSICYQKHKYTKSTLTIQPTIAITNGDKTSLKKFIEIVGLSTPIYFVAGKGIKHDWYNIHIHSKEELDKCVVFFEKYKLQTKFKQQSFNIWKKIYILKKEKAHRTQEGFNKILGLIKLLNSNSSTCITRNSRKNWENIIKEYFKQNAQKKNK